MPLHSKNTAASEGADKGQSIGDDDTEDTEDARKPADPAPTDEPCELEGADDLLEFKTPGTNVTQMHFQRYSVDSEYSDIADDLKEVKLQDCSAAKDVNLRGNYGTTLPNS